MRSQADLEAALSSLPKSLQGTYQRALAKTAETDKPYLRSAMLWLAWSLYPLRLETVVNAITLKPGMTTFDSRTMLTDPEDLFEICGTFAVHEESFGKTTETDQLRLAHHSVRDFFCDGLDHTSEFWLPAKASHRELAELCLTYLLLHDWIDLFKYDYEQKALREVDGHGLLKYAANSWPIHVLQADAEAELLPLIKKLMTPEPNVSFGIWIKIIMYYSHRSRGSAHIGMPLYYAASYGLEQTVKWLISEGAGLNDKAGLFNGTALHAACFRRHPNIVHILLDAGARTDVRDSSGMTAVDFGKVYKNVAVAKVLHEHLEKKGTPNLKLAMVARGVFDRAAERDKSARLRNKN